MRPRSDDLGATSPSIRRGTRFTRFNGAEVGWPRRSGWSDLRALAGIASIGPRPVGLGSHGAIDADDYGIPLQWVRGRMTSETASSTSIWGVPCPGFNGTEAGWPWKRHECAALVRVLLDSSMGLRPVDLGRRHVNGAKRYQYFELQWGRGRMASETGSSVRTSTFTAWGFNWAEAG